MVEDNPGDARLMQEAVHEARGRRIVLTHVDTLGKGLAKLDHERFDLVMLDLSLPDADGLETLVKMHERAPGVPIVVLTGHDDEALAIRAMREGAQDYLVKGQVNGNLVVRAMRYATERKRAIEALQQSEEYYRALIENALDIIIVLAADGTVSYGSPSFERVLGYPQGVLTHTNAFNLIHPDDRSHVNDLLDVATRNPGTTQSFECRVRHRNGTWRVMEHIGKRSESDSSISGYILNARDITERKRAEDAMQQAMETLRAVIETSPLAIYSVDLELQIKSWNSAAEHIFGYQAQDVLNCPLELIFPANELKTVKRLDNCFHGQPAVGTEERWPRRDGTDVEVSIWNAPLRDSAGNVTGAVEAIADNTERKRLEVQIQQANKMEAVGRLAGGVAHDFNNLLTVITGYCQMLLDQMEPTNSMAGEVQEIQKAAERATTLTRQLLAFSRKQIVQPKVLDLTALTGDMEQMLRRLAGKNNKLILSLGTEQYRVRVDPGHLGQVIVNLVVNARDAMPDGGEITITLHAEEVTGANERLSGLPPGPYVVLEVRDTGHGMDANTLGHLFEPFFTTKDKGRGTGLGLSTSYGNVKQNRGEILVKSEPGHGSTFSVYLPRVFDEVDTALPPFAPHGNFGGSETILLAEDEDGVRAIMTEMLEKQGYTVLAAASGLEALSLLQRHKGPLDLLVTDVVMPQMGGRELADRIRTAMPGLKVLFVSGYTDGAMLKEGELEAGTDLLQKPFNPNQLASRVRDVLDGIAS